jgi:hypothetical protein
VSGKKTALDFQVKGLLVLYGNKSISIFVELDDGNERRDHIFLLRPRSKSAGQPAAWASYRIANHALCPH